MLLDIGLGNNYLSLTPKFKQQKQESVNGTTSNQKPSSKQKKQ